MSDFSYRAARDRSAVGLHREAHPGGSHHGLMGEEGRSDERQDQELYHSKNDDERGNHDGNHGACTYGAAVAMAADTPQIEMPDASGAAHSRLKPNHLRATKYTTAQ